MILNTIGLILLVLFAFCILVGGAAAFIVMGIDLLKELFE